MWNLKNRQTSKYKNSRLQDIENKEMIKGGWGYRWEWDNIGVEKWEVQTTGCKIGYMNVLYNLGNIVNIL